MKTRSIVIAVALACCLLAAPAGNVAWACHARAVDNCCCPAPPPPVPTTLCVKDPCSCCTYEVDVCLPACCCGEQPSVSWRSGILGRKIATYCWPCCGYSLDVVITKHGHVRVRG